MLSAKNFVISAVAAAFVLAAAAAPGMATEPGDDATKTEKTEKTKKKRRGGCPFRRSITGYSVIDNEHFVLRSGGRDYLMTLSGGCHSLRYGIAIAIKSTPAAGICVQRGDRVILDNHFTCFITDIEGVENRKEAKALVEERKKAKEEEKEKEKENEEEEGEPK